MNKVDIKKIIIILNEKKSNKLKESELRFKQIIPILSGSRWKAVGENVVHCPVCDCPSEVIFILMAGPGRYDDGRCSISLRGDTVVLSYDNWHEMLSFFRDIWGMDIYV